MDLAASLDCVPLLGGDAFIARHIRSACSMRSVTTLHKYEQQRYPSRTPRLQPSLAHPRLRLGLGFGYPWGLSVWCGVSTRKRVVDYLFQL
jgi:hypothetical protein